MYRNSFKKSASLLFALGFGFSQAAAYAQALPAAGMPAPAAAATESADSNLVAQAAPGTTVLQGRVSNVDNLSRDILRSELKLEKYNLNYRLNAAKQGRWKGWRYFFFQEANLGLTEASLIKTIEYRGRHIHVPARNRRPILANGTLVPSIMASFFGGTGDAIELGINMWHSWEASKNGFSQTQSRKYVAGLIADIDKKMAEREAAIRQEPASDAELAQLQELEGKLLADFRDMSIAEFMRFHVGASRSLARENTFYMLDIGKSAIQITQNWLALDATMRRHPRMTVTANLLSTIASSMIMIDPILSRFAALGAAHMDRRSMEMNGFPKLAQDPGRLKSDYAALQGYAASHRTSDKPSITAALTRLDAYDANQNYYVNEVQKNSVAIRRGNRTAIQNMGMGLVVGGCRLVGGVLGLYAGANHQHARAERTARTPRTALPPSTATIRNAKRTNEYAYTGAIVYLPAISLAILDSWRIRLTGELGYQRQKANHTLPGQVIRARLAQLDQIEAKI